MHTTGTIMDHNDSKVGELANKTRDESGYSVPQCAAETAADSSPF